jgi:elongation factor G
VPAAHQGDVMGDINARRGRVQGTETTDDGEQEITALVPTAELLRYAVELRSMTGGRGRFVAEHDHYDALPAHLVDKATRAVTWARRRGGSPPGSTPPVTTTGATRSSTG